MQNLGPGRMHWIMQNALKSNEWWRNSVDKTFKIEIEKGRPNNSEKTFYKIRSPLFNFYKFNDSEKSTPESCRMHWSLMNNKEIGYLELLKYKHRRGDQIIQAFYKIGSP